MHTSLVKSKKKISHIALHIHSVGQERLTGKEGCREGGWGDAENIQHS